MKLKSFASLLLFLFIFSSVSFAQFDDDDPEFGDGTRAVAGDYLIIDFGTITEEVVTKEISIRNTKKCDIVIEGFSIPGGLGITVIDKVIKPNYEGKYIISVHTEYIEEAEFKRYLVVETKYKQLLGGGTVREKIVYEIKGTIKR